jgi:oligopeptide transport system ATP-binding protein
MSPLLDVKNLTTVFKIEDGVLRAVDDVSFTLEEGETLGIVGESGSGKSVTSLSIMRLVPAPGGEITKGSITFQGQDLLKLSDRDMRALRGNRIAMIFQDPMTSLNPVLTVGRQLTEAIRLHLKLDKAGAEKRAVELLARVGIPSPASRLKQYPHEFSGGMRQRVMIAMALSCNPALLIADEPTTALDVTIQAQILEVINDLKKELGMSVIMITHDLGVVAGMAQRIVVMYAGRVVEEGATRDVLKNPRMPYTIGLLRSIPRLDDGDDRRLTPIRGGPPNVAKLIHGCPFAPRCDYAVAGKCDVEAPPLRDVGNRHRAACHFDITLDTIPTRAPALSQQRRRRSLTEVQA